VITVHDLMRMFDVSSSTPLIHRPSVQERIFLSLDAAGIRRAADVIAVSHTTKRDLERYLGIPETRIAVVHEGLDHELFRVVEARPFDFPYLLYVGSGQPRKNLVTLLRAFALLKRKPQFADLKVVKVGAAAANGDHLWRQQPSAPSASSASRGRSSSPTVAKRGGCLPITRPLSSLCCLPSMKDSVFPLLRRWLAGAP
jgi:hypothetical protein